MLSYELCKKLQEANLPKIFYDDSDRFYLDSDTIVTKSTINSFRTVLGDSVSPRHYVYIPRLDDLITACEDFFSQLTKINGQPWTAEAFVDDLPIIIRAESPEEAVAELYCSIRGLLTLKK